MIGNFSLQISKYILTEIFSAVNQIYFDDLLHIGTVSKDFPYVTRSGFILTNFRWLYLKSKSSEEKSISICKHLRTTVCLFLFKASCDLNATPSTSGRVSVIVMSKNNLLDNEQALVNSARHQNVCSKIWCLAQEGFNGVMASTTNG